MEMSESSSVTIKYSGHVINVPLEQLLRWVFQVLFVPDITYLPVDIMRIWTV